MEFGEKMLCVRNHMQMQMEMEMVREQSDVNCTRSNNNNNNPTFAWYSSSWQPSIGSNNNNSTSVGLINAFHTTAAEATSPHRHAHPDPHLTCLKLGKRHYFEDSNVDGGGVPPPLRHHYVSVSGGAGERSGGTGVARCQVEGCEVALVNSKEYHRRHKVCEMHSKAPIVVVLGRDQRFCQQCSRFHVVSEFDESKRSCRRRLAGHNERRRKNSHHSQQHQHQHQHSTSLSVATNNSTQGGCALSLLSAGAGAGSESWLSHHADLSIRCSAALHELIAENRAALHITSRHHRDHLHQIHHPQWDQQLDQSHY